jgi:hypothetical protein
MCTTCRHPERARIELLLARGASAKHVGDQFGVHKDAILRHWANGHVPDHVKASLAIKALRPGQELAALVTEESTGLLEHLQRIRAVLYAQFDAAAEVGERESIPPLAAALHQNLKLAATSTGELQKHMPSNVTNILLAPAYLDLRLALLKALRPFPEAAQAVAAAFRKAEAPLIEGRAGVAA